MRVGWGDVAVTRVGEGDKAAARVQRGRYGSGKDLARICGRDEAQEWQCSGSEGANWGGR